MTAAEENADSGQPNDSVNPQQGAGPLEADAVLSEVEVTADQTRPADPILSRSNNGVEASSDQTETALLNHLGGGDEKQPVVEADQSHVTLPAAPDSVVEAVDGSEVGIEFGPDGVADEETETQTQDGPKADHATNVVKVLEGSVTAVSSDEVELDLPDGRKAVIYRRNFGISGEDPASVLSVGDGAFGAELSRDDPKGRVVLSRSWVLKKQLWERLETQAAASEYITGTVTNANKNGLILDVGVRGFIPASHVELTTVSDLSSYVGQTFETKIIEVNTASERLVLSRRPLLLKQQRQETKKLLSALKPGDIRTGAVVSLADYGAFVDLGGIRGLVHVSEMAWERVNKPSDIVSVGDEVTVKILDLNVRKRRIGLSIRHLTDDPLDKIQTGEIVVGSVSRLVDFGAFVTIGSVEGLVHLSELAEYRVQAPEEVLAPGDEVRVKILSVDLERRRVALSVRQAAEFGGL